MKTPYQQKRDRKCGPVIMIQVRLDGSVLALVDQRLFLDPRHHVAELGANRLDLVLVVTAAGRLEATPD